jgi:DNA invertase Pin-like site-specific DNA recombinase
MKCDATVAVSTARKPTPKSITTSFDMTTPEGRAMAGMPAVFAQFERELIQQRITDALKVKKEQGVELGGPAIPQATRTRMRRLGNRGHSYAKIADVLNRDGVPTARPHRKDCARDAQGRVVCTIDHGRRWYAGTVQAALGERGNGKKRGPRELA